MNEAQKIDPTAFAKAAEQISGISPEQLRTGLQALATFDAQVRGQLPAAPPETLTPQEPKDFGFVTDAALLPPAPLQLDTGPPEQPPGGGAPVGQPQTVTGVLNGVAASGMVPFTQGPTPLM